MTMKNRGVWSLGYLEGRYVLGCNTEVLLDLRRRRILSVIMFTSSTLVRSLIERIRIGIGNYYTGLPRYQEQRS